MKEDKKVEWVHLGSYSAPMQLLQGEMGRIIHVRFCSLSWRDARRWRRKNRKTLMHKVRTRNYSPRYPVEWVTCENCEWDTCEPYTTDDGTTLCDDCYEAILEGD